MFGKEDRSKFKYWFAHWCAYQTCALNCNNWKFKYLFHDIEKPFMLYFYMWICGMKHEDAYKRVQKWHRKHHKHHIEYDGNKDYDAIIIDWECSRFTKTNSPLTAAEELDKKILEKKLFDKDIFELKSSLIKLGLQNNTTEMKCRIVLG